MAGQQQLLKYNQDTLYQKVITEMLKQVDLKYANEHFRIGEKMDKTKFKHSQLFEEVLCTDECSLVNWIDRKIKGELEKTKVKRKNDFVEIVEDNNIYINNYYYNLENNWKDVEW